MYVETYMKTAGKILIIEDNTMNMKLFHDLLDAHGFQIIEATDGLQVVELARKMRPDLILMDIQLPEESGVDVIKKLKAESDIKAIPIIAVTAFAMKDNEDEVLAAGCDAYVAKPISIEPFLETVNRFLKKRA